MLMICDMLLLFFSLKKKKKSCTLCLLSTNCSKTCTVRVIQIVSSTLLSTTEALFIYFLTITPVRWLCVKAKEWVRLLCMFVKYFPEYVLVVKLLTMKTASCSAVLWAAWSLYYITWNMWMWDLHCECTWSMGQTVIWIVIVFRINHWMHYVCVDVCVYSVFCLCWFIVLAIKNKEN